MFFVYYNECALKKKIKIISNGNHSVEIWHCVSCVSFSICIPFPFYHVCLPIFFPSHSIQCKMEIKTKIIRCTACNDIFCLTNDCWLSQSSYHFQHLLHFTEFYKINLLFLYALMRFLFGMCIKFKMYLKNQIIKSKASNINKESGPQFQQWFFFPRVI